MNANLLSLPGEVGRDTAVAGECLRPPRWERNAEGALRSKGWARISMRALNGIRVCFIPVEKGNGEYNNVCSEIPLVVLFDLVVESV